MDDENTERVDLPVAAGSDHVPAPPPPPTLADPALEPPPPPAWQGSPLPPAPAVPSRIDVGEIVGRTFDTFGREWSLYLALAIPSGLSGFASAALSSSFQAMARNPASQAGGQQVPALIAQLLIAFIGAVATLAMIVVTDGFWRGTPVGLSDAVGRGARLLPRVIGLILLAMLLGVGIGLAFVVIALLVVVAGPIGILLGVLAFLLLLPVSMYVSARLGVIVPVLALEQTPVRRVIGRTWALTRGNVLALFLTAFVIGLAAVVPTWGGLMFSVFVDNRIVAGIALGLASMVVAPLGGIWTVLAWGRLTGAPYHDSEVMATGKGRLTGFVLVAGVGLLLIAIGGALAASGSREFLRLTGG